MDWSIIIVAVVSFASNAIVSFFSNNKTQALLSYRLDQLEKKQDKHNSVVERMYTCERDISTAFVKIDELRENINELKKEVEK